MNFLPASMKLYSLLLLLLVTPIEGETTMSTTVTEASSVTPASTTPSTSTATTTTTTVSTSTPATTSHPSAATTPQSTTPRPHPCASAPCENGATCVLVGNGFSCSCPTGYIGTRCHERCSAGLFGEGCNLRCGRCYNYAACHHANGSCPFGLCQSGYVTDMCNVEVAQGGTLGEEQRTWLGYGIGSGLAMALVLALFLLAARRLLHLPPRHSPPSCPPVHVLDADIQPSTYVEMYETVQTPPTPKRSKKSKITRKKEKHAAQPPRVPHLSKAVPGEGDNFYFDMNGTSGKAPENPILADPYEPCNDENCLPGHDSANVYEDYEQRQSCVYANSLPTPSRQTQSSGKRPAK